MHGLKWILQYKNQSIEHTCWQVPRWGGFPCVETSLPIHAAPITWTLRQMHIPLVESQRISDYHVRSFPSVSYQLDAVSCVQVHVAKYHELVSATKRSLDSL